MSLGGESAVKRPARTLLGYAAMIAATVSLFFAIRWFGESLTPGVPSAAREAQPATVAIRSVPLAHLLVALSAVIILGQLLARVCAYIGQPPVIGEVLAGICLGPSVLGRVAPDVGQMLMPAALAPSLSVVAQLGVIVYMFLVGLEFNGSILRKQGHVALAISHASIVVPFSLGAMLALWLYPLLASADVPFTGFALFLSVAMSITAFPVLARILTDRQINKTPLGTMALACAATDDVTAWCLLAMVVGVAQSQWQTVGLILAATALYLAAMFAIVRPMLAPLAERQGPSLARTSVALVIVGMLLSALTTEWIGIHALFGAFIFGAVIPSNSPIARQLVGHLEAFVTTFMLPAYFAFTGLRTEIALVSGAERWLVCAAIIGVATAGKFGGTLAAARVMGVGWRDSASLGILMNTRGLMELIVLNVGLDLQIISPTLFAMMVLMAIATTMATSPILSLIAPRSLTRSRAGEEEEIAAATG
jgi:Kef-type K+ transport system membrane component KefB